MNRVAPSPMKNSKTHDVKLKPACGRAVTGMLLTETNTAGRFNQDGSSTCKPVNGFTFEGKFSSSGPNAIGELRGCGVRVNAGAGVNDGVAETFAVAIIGMEVSTSMFPIQAASKEETKIKAMTLRRNVSISMFVRTAYFAPAG